MIVTGVGAGLGVAAAASTFDSPAMYCITATVASASAPIVPTSVCPVRTAPRSVNTIPSIERNLRDPSFEAIVLTASP